jgi:hypothetical protein
MASPFLWWIRWCSTTHPTRVSPCDTWSKATSKKTCTRRTSAANRQKHLLHATCHRPQELRKHRTVTRQALALLQEYNYPELIAKKTTPISGIDMLIWNFAAALVVIQHCDSVGWNSVVTDCSLNQFYVCRLFNVRSELTSKKNVRSERVGSAWCQIESWFELISLFWYGRW